MKFKGQYIWIVGASTGIGRALALELAEQGAILAISARRKELLEDLLSELDGQGHIAVCIDAGDYQSVVSGFNEICAAFPKFDRSIFMAAKYGAHDGKPKDIEFIHEMLKVNIGGAFHMLDVLVPKYKEQGFGQIAICASVAGYRGMPTGQPYCATKAALISLSESMKLDLEPYNIDVKVINPGFVRTPLTDKNDFKMPMIIDASVAAKALAKGLLSGAFEINFPKRFAYLMKTIRLLPNFMFFPLMRLLSKNR